MLGSINWGFLGSAVRELLSTYTQFASQCRFNNIVNGTFSIWPFPQYGDWLLTEDIPCIPGSYSETVLFCSKYSDRITIGLFHLLLPFVPHFITGGAVLHIVGLLSLIRSVSLITSLSLIRSVHSQAFFVQIFRVKSALNVWN